jgi:hypothetical protein
MVPEIAGPALEIAGTAAVMKYRTGRSGKSVHPLGIVSGWNQQWVSQ